jgi:hypothetical protein
MSSTDRCPHCQSVCRVPDEVAGRSVACPTCRKSFKPSETRMAGRPPDQPACSPPTASAGGDIERPQRRPHARRQPSNAGPWVLALALAGVGVAFTFCLVGIVGAVGYLLLAAPETPNNPHAAARPGGMPPAPPLPGWKELPPDMGQQKVEVPSAVPPNVGPPNNQGPPVQPKPIAQPVEYPAGVPSERADERIINGNFEQGPKAFRTAYRHSPGNVRDDLTFCLARSPRDGHGDAAAFGDHTTGKGLMMVVNGGNALDKVLWGQTVAVRPNADYTFSLWVASWYHTSPAQLEVRINGKALGRVVASTRGGEWKELTASWHSEEHEVATIEVFNLTREISGNDFAIDDISFRGPRPEQGAGKKE